MNTQDTVDGSQFSLLLRLVGWWLDGWCEIWRVILISAINYVAVEVEAELGGKLDFVEFKGTSEKSLSNFKGFASDTLNLRNFETFFVI